MNKTILREPIVRRSFQEMFEEVASLRRVRSHRLHSIPRGRSPCNAIVDVQEPRIKEAVSVSARISLSSPAEAGAYG